MKQRAGRPRDFDDIDEGRQVLDAESDEPVRKTVGTSDLAGVTFEDAERAQLRAWDGLSTAAKIDFFEEMIELAYRSGALSPERLALRDRTSPER